MYRIVSTQDTIVIKNMIIFLKHMVTLSLVLDIWPKIIVFNNIIHKKFLKLLKSIQQITDLGMIFML